MLPSRIARLMQCRDLNLQGLLAAGMASTWPWTYQFYPIDDLWPTHPTASGLKGLDHCFQQSLCRWCLAAVGTLLAFCGSWKVPKRQNIVTYWRSGGLEVFLSGSSISMVCNGPFFPESLTAIYYNRQCLQSLEAALTIHIRRLFPIPPRSHLASFAS